MPANACIDAIKSAAGRDLTDDEIDEIVSRVQAHQKRLKAEGQVTRADERLRQAAADDAEHLRQAAAVERRRAALNIIAHGKIDAAVERMVASGFDRVNAMRALNEGTTDGRIWDGRSSSNTRRNGYYAEFFGQPVMARMQRERPHLLTAKVLRDERFMDDVVREMEGTATGNPDAAYMAGVFNDAQEAARLRQNELGADIGKLDGRTPHVHDPILMMKAGADKWVSDTRPMIDDARAFPDVADPAEIDGILRDIYDTLITGLSNRPSAARKGEYSGPASLAKSLGRHRVLHFKPGMWNAYNKLYGRGTVFTAMEAEMRRMSRSAALMEVWGTNPEAMFARVAEEQAMKVKKDPSTPSAMKDKLIRDLRGAADGDGAAGAAMDFATGIASAPHDPKLAQKANEIRAAQGMAKLGGAVLTAVPSDVVTTAANQVFHGRNPLAAFGRTITEFMRGRSKGEMRAAGYGLGEGFDSLIGRMSSAHYSNDAPGGFFSRNAETFFRWNGLAGQTDIMRHVNARILSAMMGDETAKAWKFVGAKYKHVLGLHGIGEREWSVMRDARVKLDNGQWYFDPARIDQIPADERFDAFFDTTGLKPETIARKRKSARYELKMAARRYFADEISFGMIETDDASRRLARLGKGRQLRPGTLASEVMAFIAQFKGFPLAFTERVLGRAWHGGPGGRSSGAAHIGTLIAGLTIAGYMSMTAKDMAKGYEPRQPEDAKQWSKIIFASMVQSGGAGIYGDFLFAESSRFGSGALETLAGPTIGTGADVVNLWLKAKEGDAKAADVLNLATQNTPYINLFYTRPALDYLILDGMREAVSPGYLKRQARRREKDYGQERLWPHGG